MSRRRLLIADDHEPMRHILRRVLEKDYDVVAEAANGREAIDLTEQLRPDLVLLDVSMPVMGGFEAARLLRERLPDVRIIFVSQHADPVYVEEAFLLGVQGYTLKGTALTEVPEAVRLVLTGGVFRSPLIPA